MLHATWIRLVASLVVGVAVGAASWRADPLLAVPLGWDVLVVTYVAWTWLLVRTMTPAETKAHATREDPSHTVSGTALLLAAVGSLGGVTLLLLADSARAPAVDALVGVATVTASWVLVHVVYLTRYARLYYSSPHPRPVDFGDDEPGYHDFAYLAFTLGMTYQVSDTTVADRRIRMAVLRHSLLSYLLGAVAVASTVNLVSQLAAGGS